MNPLPPQPWPLVGRDEEMAAARALLLRDGSRLVTLTGPGGTGKTRLAVELADALRESFPGGTVFVDLTAQLEGGSLLRAIAEALCLPADGSSINVADLSHAVGTQPLLLVLDNVEHLLDEAPAVGDLLGACPALTVLATSRAPLRLGWEHELPVPPLALPVLDPLPPASALAQSPAVALFVQRAQAVDPTFRLTDEHAAAVAQVCARLDGLPLAIELAAARVKLLPPAEILRRLGGGVGGEGGAAGGTALAGRTRLGLLSAGRRDAPPRQRTLRDTIAWSDAQLSEAERRLFRRLAVFVGGFTLEAAIEVAAPSPDSPLPNNAGATAQQPGGEHEAAIMEALASLVDKSLVVRQAGKEQCSERGLWADGRGSGIPRFTMLQTIREYALEQLAATGEWDVLRRHAVYFLALAERAEPYLTRPERREWHPMLREEHENLGAALEWALSAAEVTCTSAPSGHPESRGPQEPDVLALRLAGALWRFWGTQGYSAKGRRWLERALALPAAQDASTQRARALHGAGMLAHQAEHGEAALPLLSESVALFRQLRDTRGLARALVGLGMVLGCSCSARQARRAAALARRTPEDTLLEAIALAESTGDTWCQAFALYTLGARTGSPGDARDAARRAQALDRSAALFHEIGDEWGVALVLSKRGYDAAKAGDYVTAGARFEQALALWREEGERALAVHLLNAIGETARFQGDYALARAYYEESLLLFGRQMEQPLHVAMVLHNLGYVALRQGQVERAGQYFAEALGLNRRHAGRRGLVECLVGLAAVLAARHQPDDAVRLFSAAERARQDRQQELDETDRQEYERSLAQARAALEGTQLDAAWRAGQTLDLDSALAQALSLLSRPAPEAPASRPPLLRLAAPTRDTAGAAAGHSASGGTLSPREEEVALLVAEGCTNRHIAERLVIAERTVANHVDHIMTKLGFRSRAQIAAWAARRAIA